MIDSKFYLHDEYIFPKLYLKTKKGIWLFNYIFFSCKRNEGGREYEANNPTNFNNISQPSAKLIRSNETSRFNYSLRSTIRGKKKKKKKREKRKKKLPRKKSGGEVVRTPRITKKKKKKKSQSIIFGRENKKKRADRDGVSWFPHRFTFARWKI